MKMVLNFDFYPTKAKITKGNWLIVENDETVFEHELADNGWKVEKINGKSVTLVMDE